MQPLTKNCARRSLRRMNVSGGSLTCSVAWSSNRAIRSGRMSLLRRTTASRSERLRPVSSSASCRSERAWSLVREIVPRASKKIRLVCMALSSLSERQSGSGRLGGAASRHRPFFSASGSGR
ncbi:MAG: hypothetical protein ACLSVO_08770 [Alistipes sp.]